MRAVTTRNRRRGPTTRSGDDAYGPLSASGTNIRVRSNGSADRPGVTVEENTPVNVMTLQPPGIDFKDRHPGHDDGRWERQESPSRPNNVIV